MDEPCPHVFRKFRRWPIKDRWRCVFCRMVTRSYDGVDQRAMRPIHPHMSVALKGYNTTKGYY